MKKWLDAIWGDFDKEDPTEWILIIFGFAMMFVFGIVAILQ